MTQPFLSEKELDALIAGDQATRAAASNETALHSGAA
jgi:hypothetical protein